MKLAQIVNKNFLEALERLRAQKISMKASFAIVGISKKVREEISKFEEARKSALERLCDKDESGLPIMEGENFKLSSEALGQLASELSELTSLEVHVGKIQIKDLGDMAGIVLSPKDLEILHDLFE